MDRRRVPADAHVSVLFSEPKIPQSSNSPSKPRGTHRFSALQRAENSSIPPLTCGDRQCDTVSVLFSEPKIPQWDGPTTRRGSSLSFSALQRAENSSIIASSFACMDMIKRFSALQRAENSSIFPSDFEPRTPPLFQCSSASRKFLNRLERVDGLPAPSFQCSSASRKFLNFPLTGTGTMPACVSVLFSEPKIPQSRPSHLRPSIFPTAMITLRQS